jgi:DNA-binding CsgD family transcriptional regulator
MRRSALVAEVPICETGLHADSRKLVWHVKLLPDRASSVECRERSLGVFFADCHRAGGLRCDRPRERSLQDGAQLEFDAALEAFERLGAGPDVRRVSAIAATAEPPSAAGLTGREIEVLRLIATGVTNRAIAARLGISEKTVARHLSNIFTKLDLPSRSAATAYAYEHKLV